MANRLPLLGLTPDKPVVPTTELADALDATCLAFGLSRKLGTEVRVAMVALLARWRLRRRLEEMRRDRQRFEDDEARRLLRARLGLREGSDVDHSQRGDHTGTDEHSAQRR